MCQIPKTNNCVKTFRLFQLVDSIDMCRHCSNKIKQLAIIFMVEKN